MTKTIQSLDELRLIKSKMIHLQTESIETIKERTDQVRAVFPWIKIMFSAFRLIKLKKQHEHSDKQSAWTRILGVLSKFFK